MIGVLGGMGPLATADFYGKLIEATAATCDQEHIPVVIYAASQVPDRTAALVAGGPSPLPALMAGLRVLVAAGANAIAIPCCSAHAWYEPLARASPVPILHIVDAAADAATREFGPDARLGLVATAGVLATDFCARRLAEHGFACMLPSELEMTELVTPAIALVKSGEAVVAGPMFERVVASLLERGATAVVLGCTEVPVALDRSDSPLRARCVDATAALAAACVTFHRREHRARTTSLEGISP